MLMRKTTHSSARRRPSGSTSTSSSSSSDSDFDESPSFDFDAFDPHWAEGLAAFDLSDPYLLLVIPRPRHCPTIPPGPVRSPSDDRLAFEDMMERSRALEDPFATAIVIVNETDGDLNSCPTLEFAYTDRYRFSQDVGKRVPKVGCGCEGACDPSPTSRCPCLQLQTRLVKGSVPAFAYDEDGLLRPDLVDQKVAIVECSSTCGCSDACTNRVVRKGRRVDVELFETEDRGHGVRATAAILANQYISVYGGDLLTEKEALKREDYYNIIRRTYLFNLDFPSVKTMTKVMTHPQSDQAQRPAKKETLVVDAYSTGNFTRFINHSCEPNLGVESVWFDDFDARRPRIAFFARRDIAAGEELTFSYSGSRQQEDALDKELAASSQPEETAEQLVNRLRKDPRSSNTLTVCKCGAVECKGVVFVASARTGQDESSEEEEDDEGDREDEVEAPLPYPDDSGSDYEPGTGDEEELDPVAPVDDIARSQARTTRRKPVGPAEFV